MSETNPEANAQPPVEQPPVDTRPVPTVGRIVLYQLCESDVAEINDRRTRAIAHKRQSDRGNQVEVGQVYPMLIVRVWGNTPGSCVNGRVVLDGHDVFWVTSRCCGDKPAEWQWPQRT
jgi:hypothetical protein